MSKRHILILLFVLAFITAFCDQLFANTRYAQSDLLAFGPLLVFSVLQFMWVRMDANERQFRRTPLLNTGVVALGFIFIPVYLIRSRARGQRARALGWFVVCAFVFAGVSLAGAWMGSFSTYGA